MDLIDRFKNKTNADLVRIVETAEDYQPEAVEVAKKTLRFRNIGQSELLRLAREVQGERIEAYLNEFSVLNDKLKMPESFFLNEEEMKLLFKTRFTHWKEANDDLIPDSWLYVLGAGFG